MRSPAAVPIGLLCSLALAVPTLTVAAEDIFLAIPGLDGESTDAQFSGAIEAVSVTNGVTLDTTGGGGNAKANFAPVVVKLRRTSAASLGLQQAVANGHHYSQAVVSFRRPGEKPFVFLTYTFTEVVVTSFQSDASVPLDTPGESVTLTYARIKTDYFRQNADGSAGPVMSVCWDLRSNSQCQ